MKPVVRLIILVAAACGLPVMAAPALADISEFRHISTFDGLSDMTVSEIYRDGSGYVYFGTGTGIDRFDGIRMRSWTSPGSHERLKRINAITSDDRGTIYAGNLQGLLRIDAAGDMLVSVDPRLDNVSVNGLATVGDSIYMATDKGLYIRDFDGHALSAVLPVQGAFSDGNKLNAIAPDSAGQLWLTGRGVIHRYVPSTGEIRSFPAPERFASLTFEKIVAGDGGNLFISANNGEIIRYDINGGGYMYLYDSERNIVTSLQFHSPSALIVGLDGGGIRFVDTATGEPVASFSHTAGSHSSLSSNSVYSALLDDEGILWVGLYQGGVDYSLRQTGIFDVWASPGLIDTKGMTVRALAIDGDDMLIGTRDGLHYVNKARGIARTYRTPVLRSNMIFAIRRVGDLYYVGTYGGGLYIFDPRTLSLRSFVPEATLDDRWNGFDIFSLATDPQGRLWIGTSRGAHCFEGDREVLCFTSFNSPLPPGNVYEIFFDSTGTGWICTENGLAVYTGGQLQTTGFPPGLNARDKYREIYEDASHNLYFVPDRGAVKVADLNLTDVSVFRGKDLPDSFWKNLSPTFITEDGRGGCWLGSVDGLYRFDDKGRYVQFGYIDGIPSQTFTLCQPVIDEGGNLWLGNNSGLLRVDAADLDNLSLQYPPITINEVVVNGRSFETELAGGTLDLSSKENNLNVRFSDLTFTSPSYMMAEYRLIRDGDPAQDWSMIRGSSELNFYDLSPGSYTLDIRRVGMPETRASLAVRIRPSMLGLWNALFILGIIIVAALTAVIVIRRHKRLARTAYENSVSANPEDQRYRTLRLSDEECRRLLRVIDRLMKHDRLYTDANLKLRTLADRAGSSPNALSYVFNVYLGSSYNDYVNTFRIARFKELVAEGDISKYTLTALSERCGFSSRASFFRNFKKATGLTPADYIRRTQ